MEYSLSFLSIVSLVILPQCFLQSSTFYDATRSFLLDTSKIFVNFGLFVSNIIFVGLFDCLDDGIDLLLPHLEFRQEDSLYFWEVRLFPLKSLADFVDMWIQIFVNDGHVGEIIVQIPVFFEILMELEKLYFLGCASFVTMELDELVGHNCPFLQPLYLLDAVKNSQDFSSINDTNPFNSFCVVRAKE